MYVKEIESIKNLQEQLVGLKKTIENKCHDLETNIGKIVKTELEKHFPQVNFYWSVDFDSCMYTDKWEPGVYFYSVKDSLLSGKGFWFADDYSNGEFKKLKPPVPTKKLLEFLKLLSANLGINCRMVRHEPTYFRC